MISDVSVVLVKHLLLRLPFSGYRENVEKFKHSQKALSITPYHMVKAQMVSGLSGRMSKH